MAEFDVYPESGMENLITEPLSKAGGKASPQAHAASLLGVGHWLSNCAAMRRLKAAFASDTFGPLLTAVPLALCFSLFPNVALNASWDGSWAAVLNYVHGGRWQFGTELVFPYGPLGYVMSPYFWPSTFWSRLAFTAVMNLLVTVSVCRVAWRLRFGWRLLAVGTFVLTAANIEYGVPDFLLNVGLLSLGLLCLFSQGPPGTLQAGGLILLGGFASLAKFSAMLTAGLTVVVVAAHFFLSGHRKAALAIALGWISAVLFAWMILGQNLSHLTVYLVRGFILSSGYDQAMGLEPSTSVWLCGLILALAAFCLVLMAQYASVEGPSPTRRTTRVLRTSWLLALLFLTWKHGFVRADKHHVVYFAGFVAVLASWLQLVPSSSDKARLVRSGGTIATCALALATIQFSFEPQYVDVFKPWVHLDRNIKALLSPGSYFKRMNAELEAQQIAARLPKIREMVGMRSIDVFGNNQAFAVLNGMNLQPRPVFQSYAAYSETLMRLNERYYSSGRAPEFVLLNLDPIDRRFPSLEDARVLGRLRSWYSFAGSEGRFILLRRRAQSAGQTGSAEPEAPKTVLVKQGVLQAGAELDVSCFGQTNLWVELMPEPTLFGRLRQFCYRQAPLKLRVWKGSEQTPQEFRAPASMLTAGFVASPLLSETSDVAAAFIGRDPVCPNRYALNLGNEGQLWWKKDIRYRISRIEFE